MLPPSGPGRSGTEVSRVRATAIISLGCCSALTALLAFTPMAVSQDYEEGEGEKATHPEHVDHEHRFVKITGRNIRPDVLRISQDESIGWLYYGAQTARVSFDGKVAESITCSAPGAFRLEGDRVESRPIKRYEFVSFCRLKPGEYGYRVALGGSRKVMTAKVIVE